MISNKIFTKGIYRHYKGDICKVLFLAKHSETLEDLVIYQPMYGELKIWERPLTMFLENITFEGKLVPRFKFTEVIDD
jgi:hypothetical protein